MSCFSEIMSNNFMLHKNKARPSFLLVFITSYLLAHFIYLYSVRKIFLFSVFLYRNTPLLCFPMYLVSYNYFYRSR